MGLLRRWLRRLPFLAYRERLAGEQRAFRDVVDVNALPRIYDYWAWKHLKPLFEEFGFSDVDTFFVNALRASALRTGAARPVFLSVGAGNCDLEVRLGKALRAQGLAQFTFECLDFNAAMLARGRALAEREGLATHFEFTKGDFNRWKARRHYDGILASHSLHHVVALEHLFDAIRAALAPRAYFVVSDMIGRNGHQRWPEALVEVQRFWAELPASHRYNHQLKRHEERFLDWDCSGEGFEGIRAQDILCELVKRFEFPMFLAFGNLIDVFVDRAFGPNFSVESAWDLEFIDRVHARDEELLRAGKLTPTHMLAILSTEPAACVGNRGQTPILPLV